MPQTPMSHATDDLEAGRQAAARRDWPAAYEALSRADAARPLDPDDLELLAKAAWWRGHSDESIAAREREYAAYVERGDAVRAALAALVLRRQYTTKLSPSVAQGWLSRAERLLEGQDDPLANGYLAIARAENARDAGDFDGAIAHVDRAVELAAAAGDRNLHGWSVMRRGEVLFASGATEEGWKLLEEVAVAAVGGELGSYTTGAVFCNVITTCRDLADYGRGKEWADAAKRWCERQAISGFPGVCRIRRAEIMRLLGTWREAEAEVLQACEELPEFSPYFASEAYHELGEVRLRTGDLPGAEEAFRQARALGADPQPGSALLQLAQGKADSAWASIRRSLDEHPDRLERARLLPALAEISYARGDPAGAEEAAAELEATAAEFSTAALAANADLARGVALLLGGDDRAAIRSFRGALQRWREIDAPYETARSTWLLSDALAAGGDAEGAALELETARLTFERLGAELDERRAAARLAELRPAAGPQVAQRTLVFTDIVGSTALLEAIGDEAWGDLRRWHDETLRRCVAEHGGEEVDHTGDGFFVAFPKASAAISCARDIQRILAEHRRGHGFAPQVRIGVHAADASRIGGKYTGRGVHTAARIGAVAGAGEIVASATTVAELDGIDVGDRRVVELKGIAEPVEVVSIAWR